MAIREVTVTVRMEEHEWQLIEEAAECAGMPVHDYLSWNMWLLAQQARPAAASTRHQKLPLPRHRRITAAAEEPEEQAWAESFTERLSHRSAPYRDE